MKKIILAMVVLMAVLFGGDYEEGEKAYNAGNYKKALSLWKQGADKGDFKALANLGFLYSIGEGVEQSDTKAKEYHLKALKILEKQARQGTLKAQKDLVNLYTTGILSGIVDNGKAFTYLKMAADNGDYKAQHDLANWYALGMYDIDISFEKANEYYEKSAKQGYALAQYDLALSYMNGEGVSKNLKKAFEWNEKAAKQGLDKAQNNLGILYWNGMGVNKDVKKAKIFFQYSSDQGYKIAEKNLFELCKNSPEVCTQKKQGKSIEKNLNSKAKSQYQSSCALCHNTDAMGAPAVGDKNTWTKVMKKGKDKVYYNAIHGINGMPPKGGNSSLTDQEIKEIVDYMSNK